MLSARISAIFMEQHLKLEPSDGDLLVYHSQYRQLIGRLIYLMITCPDTLPCSCFKSAYAVSTTTTP